MILGPTDSVCRNSSPPKQPFGLSCWFNLLAEFQRAAGLSGYQQPASLRTQVLICGAIPGRAGRRLVLHLSQSWGGLARRIPLLDNILNWEIPNSPKFEPELMT